MMGCIDIAVFLKELEPLVYTKTRMAHRVVRGILLDSPVTVRRGHL
jgi:hypothetical protein